jgi:hypothetical protein
VYRIVSLLCGVGLCFLSYSALVGVVGGCLMLVLLCPIYNSFLQIPSIGNLTVTTYTLPSSPVSKPACVPLDDQSVGCMQDGVVQNLNVTEDYVNVPVTFTYTFCMLEVG